MEVRVQLKICEGCGCLWYRTYTDESVYCRSCETKLEGFPSPESRKRRGRPSGKRAAAGKRLAQIYAVAEAAGGAA